MCWKWQLNMGRTFQKVELVCTLICALYNTIINQTLIFEWQVVSYESKNKHRKTFV